MRKSQHVDFCACGLVAGHASNEKIRNSWKAQHLLEALANRAEQRPEQAALAAGGLRVTGGTRPMPCAPRRRLAGHGPVPRRTLNQRRRLSWRVPAALASAAPSREPSMCQGYLPHRTKPIYWLFLMSAKRTVCRRLVLRTRRSPASSGGRWFRLLRNFPRCRVPLRRAVGCVTCAAKSQ